MVLDLKNNLKKYIPSLFEMLNDDRIRWAEISRKFQETYDARLVQYNQKGSLRVAASFFDVISAALNKQKSAIRLLDYFQKLFEEISGRLSFKQKQQLKSTVYNLLIINDTQYLHFIGELSVLNQLIKSGNYVFQETEFNLGNGKSVDFHFKDKRTGKDILIEVYNIILDRDLKGDEQIKKFLTHRLTQKINNKTKGRTDLLNFELVPVIWATSENLQRFSNFYKSGHIINVPNCLPACAYITFTTDDDQNVHRFGMVHSL